MKTFKIADLDIWITNVFDKESACFIAYCCRYGITLNDLEEVEKVPDDVESYSLGAQPPFDPTIRICIDPLKNDPNLLNDFKTILGEKE